MAGADLRRAWAAFERNAREVLDAERLAVRAAGHDHRRRTAPSPRGSPSAPPPRRPPPRSGAVGARVRDRPGSGTALEGLRAASEGPSWSPRPRSCSPPRRCSSGGPRRCGASRAVTLAIDATRLGDAETAVVGLVDGCGLADDDELDLLALVAPLDARQSARVCARYGRRAGGGRLAPRVRPDELPPCARWSPPPDASPSHGLRRTFVRGLGCARARATPAICSASTCRRPRRRAGQPAIGRALDAGRGAAKALGDPTRLAVAVALARGGAAVRVRPGLDRRPRRASSSPTTRAPCAPPAWRARAARARWSCTS